MIWVDQPAGVGFSYQAAGDSLTDTEEEVAEVRKKEKETTLHPPTYPPTYLPTYLFVRKNPTSIHPLFSSFPMHTQDLYHFLQAFYTANPKFISNDFYIFGESYGEREKASTSLPTHPPTHPPKPEIKKTEEAHSCSLSLHPPMHPKPKKTGGHFVPAVGHKIHAANKASAKGQAIPINLRGLGIGNGFTGTYVFL